jgi:hypothetical protein
MISHQLQITRNLRFCCSTIDEKNDIIAQFGQPKSIYTINNETGFLLYYSQNMLEEKELDGK